MQDGNIQLEVDAKGNLKTPTILKKASGKVSTSAHAFSDQNWGKAMRKLTAVAGWLNTDKLSDIMNEAHCLINQSPNADDPKDSEDE